MNRILGATIICLLALPLGTWGCSRVDDPSDADTGVTVNADTGSDEDTGFDTDTGSDADTGSDTDTGSEDPCAPIFCGPDSTCQEGVCVDDEVFDEDPLFAEHEIGVRYHSLEGSPSVFQATFINDYHLDNNRQQAIDQMQEMVDSGVTLIHLTIWPAGAAPHSWGSHFPLSDQELDNVEDFVRDVRDLRAANTGIAPMLHISLLDGGSSQFKTVQVNDVFPIAGGGQRDGTEFLATWHQVIDDLVGRVGAIRHDDDSPVVQRMYLGGELMLYEDGSSPYDGAAGWILQWFLTNTFPHFWDACTAVGIQPSTYFFAWPIVASKILDGSWLDIVRSTLTWWQTNLPDYVPDRLDISIYTGDHNVPDYTADQRQRILATAAGLDALVVELFGPEGVDYAFVEGHYYDVETDHPAVRQEAFGAYRDMMDPLHPDHHPRFRGLHFWPYPYSIQGSLNENGAAPPFDIDALVP